MLQGHLFCVCDCVVEVFVVVGRCVAFQNILFLGLCTISAVLVTRPVTTAAVLLGLALTATVLAAVFRQRSFCNYLCPVSGFLSLYAMAAVAEVRARDAATCRDCRSKACAAGGTSGWGCPWACNPGRLDRNNYCGMCMECIKTCPNDNMTINLRPFVRTPASKVPTRPLKP